MLALILVVSGRAGLAEEISNTKAVLVTGASSGIGLQIAKTLSRNGFHVYAGARKAEDLETSARQTTATIMGKMILTVLIAHPATVAKAMTRPFL